MWWVASVVSVPRRAKQPLHNCLSPFYHNTLDFVLLEKSEDQLRDMVGGVGRGRAGLDANPDHDGAKTAVLLISGRTMCVKKRAMSIEAHLTSCALMMSRIWGPTAFQTSFRGVLKTPWTDLMGTWPNLPIGLGNGVVGASERYTGSGQLSSHYNSASFRRRRDRAQKQPSPRWQG